MPLYIIKYFIYINYIYIYIIKYNLSHIFHNEDIQIYGENMKQNINRVKR